MQATAVAEAPVKTYEVGEKLHGWTCARVEYVKEFGCTGYLFQHDKTGPKIIKDHGLQLAFFLEVWLETS